MKFVDDARRWWRWFSVQAMAALVALHTAWDGIPGIWNGIPDDFKHSMPRWFLTVATLGLLAFGIGGRLVKQKKDE